MCLGKEYGVEHRFHDIAHDDYEWALRRAFWQRVSSKLQNRPIYLTAFDEIYQTIQKAQHRVLGVMDIAVDDIIGSSGRYRDFTPAFLPLREIRDDRWVNIAQAHFEGIQLPPINLYKIDEAYFIMDGNNRVSVARILGHEFVRAKVVEIDTSQGRFREESITLKNVKASPRIILPDWRRRRALADG